MNTVSLSDQLAKLTARAKQAQARAAAAETKTRRDLETDVAAARASAHAETVRLGELAEVGRGAVLCGYSLGGRLALHAALRDPGAYAGLVTVGASAGIEPFSIT